MESQEQRLLVMGGQLERNETRMEGMEKNMEELKEMMLELGGKVDGLKKQKQVMELPAIQTRSGSNFSPSSSGEGLLQRLNLDASPMVSQSQSRLVTSHPDHLIFQSPILHASVPPITSPLQNKNQPINPTPVIHHPFNQNQLNSNHNFTHNYPPNQPTITHIHDNQFMPPQNYTPPVLQNTQPYCHNPYIPGQNQYWYGQNTNHQNNWQQPCNKPPKMDFPHFDGSDLRGWAIKCDQYFEFNPMEDFNEGKVCFH